MWKSIPRTEQQIDETLAALREAWLAFPHLRLGQLISNAVPGVSDVFYVTDDAMTEALRRYTKLAVEG